MNPSKRLDWAGEKVQRIVPDRVLREDDFALVVGLKKHPGAEWSSDAEPTEYFQAMARHLIAYLGGEMRCPIDGQHHLSAVRIRCAQLIDKDLKDATSINQVQR